MGETGKRTSSVCGVLLAGGTSSRFGDENKLLVEIDGVPLVRRVADSMAGSRLGKLIAVTGFQGDRVAEALAGLDLQIVRNPDFETGMASSISCGVAGIGQAASGAMIVLADMPGVSARLFDRLLDAFEEAHGEKITFPVDAEGRQGNPVIWPRAFFGELLTLTGDTGAKALIRSHESANLGVPVGDEAAFRDIDAPADLVMADGDRSP